MKNTIFLLFAFVMFFVTSTEAQSGKIKVSLNIDAKDSIKSDIESYTKRELRALNDIDLYSTKPDYEIQLVAIQPNNIVAISVVVVRKYDFTSYINNVLSSKNVDEKKILIETLASKERVGQHFLSFTPTNKISELCKSIVADIDANTFENQRKANRLIQEAADKKLSTTNSKNNSKTATSDDEYWNNIVNQLPVIPSTVRKPVNAQSANQNNQPVFMRRYVGGNKTPQIVIKNGLSVILNLKFCRAEFVIAAGKTKLIETVGEGVCHFEAIASSILPIKGEENLERGYVYTWNIH